MTYFNRQFQLNRTLRSFEESKHRNFEVIVVDDQSTDLIVPLQTSFPVTIYRTEGKHWTDREIPTNMGVLLALKKGAEIIIMQNAECFHIGDVISFAERINDNTYLSFACYSIDEKTTFSNEDFSLNERIVEYLGDNAWYNHPIHRPVAFDFCSVFTRNTMIKLNGYDERFSLGVGYGDNNLVDRVNAFGLKIEIPTDPFVVHQWHYTSQNTDYRKPELITKNAELYLSLSLNKYFRAEHLVTENFDQI